MEEDWHIFFECEGSKEAWNVMGLGHIIQQRMQEAQNIKELIFNLCYFENSQVAGKAAVLIWHIWQNRNNQVWNNTKISARQIGIKADQSWEEWALVQGLIEEQPGTALQHNNSAVQQHTAGTPALQWLPPRPGVLKCNVDASFYEAAGYTGWGWCLRDHRGRFILAGTNLTQGRLSTLEGEAMALKEAIEEALSKGFSHVTFESDSKNVVEAISSRQVGSLEFSIVISHIKSLLLLAPNFEVKFIKQQANNVAHHLARAAYSIASRHIFESIPRCIEQYLIIEMN